MSISSPNQIKIGRAPDFVMRIGKVDIYHKAMVYYFSHGRKYLHSDVVSDRSLQTVAKIVRDVFAANEAMAAVDKINKTSPTRRILLNSQSGFILATLRLPKNLERSDFLMLCQYFRKFIRSEYGHLIEPRKG
jgi:hypothetical protein